MGLWFRLQISGVLIGDRKGGGNVSQRMQRLDDGVTS